MQDVIFYSMIGLIIFLSIKFSSQIAKFLGFVLKSSFHVATFLFLVALAFAVPPLGLVLLLIWTFAVFGDDCCCGHPVLDDYDCKFTKYKHDGENKKSAD